MRKSDLSLKLILAGIVVLLGVIALRPFFDPALRVQAQSARFDHVLIVSTFLYKGQTGLMVMDKRNGNVWFFQRTNDQNREPFLDPVFLTRMQFEKLDHAPQ